MTSASVRAKRATLLDKVNGQAQAIESLASMTTETLAELQADTRRLKDWRKGDKPTIDELVQRVTAIEWQLKDLQQQVDADSLVPWWRRPWW